MIVEAIIGALFAVISTIFTAIGILPNMPTAITDVVDSIQTFAISGMAVIFGIFGKAFTLAVFTTIITLIAHQQLFNMVSWTYHKIRG